MATTSRRLVLDGKPSIPGANDEAAMRAAVAQIRTRLEKLDAAVNRSFTTLDASSPQKSLESLQNQIAILSKQLENLAAQVDAATSARQPTYLAMQLGDDAEDGQPGPPGPRGEQGERGHTLLIEQDESEQHLVIGPAGPPGPSGSTVVLDFSECCGDDLPVGFPPSTGAGAGTVTSVDITQPAAGITATGGPITSSGSITLALADDLAALEGLGSTGLAVRTAANTWAQRTLTAPAAGLTITNPGGVAGNPTFALADDLLGLESLLGAGLVARTAMNTFIERTIMAAPNSGISIVDGDGVLGNPQIGASIIPPLKGGTGVANNTASTITISGAFASTFTLTGTTTVTFPTTGTLATTAQLPVGANPSASVGLTAVNGSATTFMRSDGAPVLSQSISPTWTGSHLFVGGYTPSNATSGLFVGTRSSQASMLMVDSTAAADQKYWEIVVALGGGEWRLRGVNDAFNASRNAFTFNRSGAAITAISLGNVTDAPPVILPADNQELRIGAGADIRLYHDGTDSYIENDTGTLRIKSGGDLQISEGQVALQTVGKGMSIKEGTNAKQGIVTLVGGAAVVTNTSVTATSRIMLTPQNASGGAGSVSVTARTAGTSFTIGSTNVLDTRDIAYVLFEVS